MTAKLKLLLCAGLLALAGCTHEKDDSATGPGPTDESNRAYIDGIVPHHEMALMMADEAMMKAVHPSLKEMAGKMKEDQSKEIDIFKDTRTRLFGSDATPDPMPMKEIPAGPEFDKIFIHMMIDHHQGAIDQSVLALDAGVVNPLDSLASTTVEKQKMEQQMLQDSLKAWYGEEHKIGDGHHM